jgi:Flp pilus assembly protein TadD
VVIFTPSKSFNKRQNLTRQLLRIGVIEMAQNHINFRLFYRYSILAMLLVFGAVAVHAQSGGGIDRTGTGGLHSISGRLVFPSGKRADYQLKVRLESPGLGDLSVMSDLNGTFSFQSLRAGNYTVVIEGGEFFESVRESVFIEPYSIAPRNATGNVAPLSRPITVQVYLRPKRTGTAAHIKPGVLNAALVNVPRPAVELYDKGIEFAQRSETEKAIDHLKRAVGLYPNFGLALNELGVQYLKRGELDKAAEALIKVLQLSPDAPEPSLNYGIVLLQQKKFAEAEAQLRNAVKKNDSTYTAHLYFGITLIYIKNYAEAETELQKAVALGGPKAGQAHYYLGGLYWQTGKHREAADQLDMYLKLEPKAANAEKVRTTVKELRSKS